MARSAPTIVDIISFTVPVSSKTTWIALEIRLSDGTVGYGEATRFGMEKAILAAIEKARSLARDTSSSYEALNRLRAAPASEPMRIVASAFEMALLDALSARAEVLLAALLGGPARDSIPVYANINRGVTDRSPAGFAARARTVVEEHGYQAVKLAPFDELAWNTEATTSEILFARGIERIMAVREAIGPWTRLLVDCHGRLSPITFRRMVREMETCDLFWIEDPLCEWAFDQNEARAARSFANDRGIRLAGGETLWGVAGARDLLAQKRYDVLLPDLRWTGIRTGMAILELAEASGVATSLHNPVSPILDRVSLQVAAAASSFLMLERQVAESPKFGEIEARPISLTKSGATLPREPGLSHDINPKALAALAGETLARSPNAEKQ